MAVPRAMPILGVMEAGMLEALQHTHMRTGVLTVVMQALVVLAVVVTVLMEQLGVRISFRAVLAGAPPGPMPLHTLQPLIGQLGTHSGADCWT